MRQVNLTLQGPLGYGDKTETYSEDSLLLTASGEVKFVRRLREGEELVKFGGQAGTAQRWTIIQIEWVRRDRK